MKAKKTILIGCILIIAAFIITFFNIIFKMIQYQTVNPENFAENFWNNPAMATATMLVWFGGLLTILGVRKLILKQNVVQ